MPTDLTVAQTILAQLGGRTFLAMTGAKDLVGDEKSLMMKLRPNQSKANKLRITLNDNDLYDLEFMRLRKFEMKPICKHENIHVEDLQRTFTQVTGYDTIMPRILGVNA